MLPYILLFYPLIRGLDRGGYQLFQIPELPNGNFSSSNLVAESSSTTYRLGDHATLTASLEKEGKIKECSIKILNKTKEDDVPLNFSSNQTMCKYVIRNLTAEDLGVYRWQVTTHTGILKEANVHVSLEENLPIERLPLNIKPQNYKIYLDTVTQENVFLGTVHIQVSVLEPTERIILHKGNSINIQENGVNLKSLTHEKVAVLNHRYDNQQELYTIVLAEPVRVGQYILQIPFTGGFQTDNKGLFKMDFKEGTLNGTHFISTFFEPNYARRAFPCFDEPAMKAVFQVRIKRPLDKISISNMDVISEMKTASSYIWDIYQDTPLMSSYLVFFYIGNKLNRRTTKVNSRIFYRPSVDAEQKLDSLSQVVEKSFHKMIQLTQITVSSSAIDMIILPGYPVSGMEHFGMIAVNEEDLFEKNDTSSNPEYPDVIMAHEVAHQWLGNLVTMNWWRELWLKEGFTQYFQYKLLHHSNPQNRYLERFGMDEIAAVLDNEDIYPNVAPLLNKDFNYEKPNRVSVYNKGSTVARMIEQAMGEHRFISAMRQLLFSHSYSNITEDNLWTTVEKVSGDNTLGKKLATWTHQTGYPLVTVKREYGEGPVTFRQERFFITESNKRKPNLEDLDATWDIPITYKFLNKDKKPKSFWLDEKNKTVCLDQSDQQDIPLLVNYEQKGLYRVNYDDRNWKSITHVMMTNHAAIPVINRGQLISDAFASGRAGLLSYNIILDLTQYLDKERRLGPLKSALDGFAFFESFLRRSDAFENLKTYMYSLLCPWIEDFFYKKENETLLPQVEESRVKTNLVQRLCSLDHPFCVEISKSELKKWIRSGKITFDKKGFMSVRKEMACAAIKHGTREDWIFLNNTIHNNITDQKEKEVFSSALTCTTDKNLLIELIRIPPENQYTDVITSFFRNPKGKEVYHDLRESLQGFSTIYIQDILAEFNSEDDLEIVNSMEDGFDEEKKFVQNVVRDNIEWKMKHEAEIRDWLYGKKTKTVNHGKCYGGGGNIENTFF